MKSVERTIFKASSTTYYWGARLFPKPLRDDVLKLYSFLRVADDYVDCQPAKGKEFRALRRAWERASKDQSFDVRPVAADTIDQRVIKNAVKLYRRYHFDPSWMQAFWDAMQSDLEGRKYRTLEDSLEYVYGSAEAVGLMMAVLMRLPEPAERTARLQGRALQWINFIRDLDEDNKLGRCYFPAQDLLKFGLSDLHETTARKHPEAFAGFMRFQIQRYREWQAQADEGVQFMPGGIMRPGLKTAIDMYNWTADQIAADPFVVFRRKVKPSKRRLLVHGVRNVAASRFL